VVKDWGCFYKKFIICCRDRLFFSNNVTQWSEKLPAIYHGHFAFFDVEKLAEDKTKNIIFINVIRKPLDR